jgi:mono/diheme cytochrome c family protein
LSKGGQLQNDKRFLRGQGAQRLVTLILLAPLLSVFTFADGASETYKVKCSACHAVSGAGDTMIGKNLKLRPLASAEVQNQTDEELFSIISKGKQKMPSFDKKLSRDEIHGLVRHIRSFKK